MQRRWSAKRMLRVHKLSCCKSCLLVYTSARFVQCNMCILGPLQVCLGTSTWRLWLQEQDPKYYDWAHEIDGNPIIQRFAALARELKVVGIRRAVILQLLTLRPMCMLVLSRGRFSLSVSLNAQTTRSTTRLRYVPLIVSMSVKCIGVQNAGVTDCGRQWRSGGRLPQVAYPRRARLSGTQH